jgi:sugar lactone lactonase YvrE
MTIDRIELVIESQAILAESPCWDEKKQLLYWVDILQKQLHIYQPQTNRDRIIQLDELVSCVVLRESGGVVLTLQSGFAGFDLDTEQINFLIQPENHPLSNRFNDGKCDPFGRFLAGTMAIDETPRAGALYCLDEHLKIKRLLGELSISNGIGWSPDYLTMYLIDSPTKNVFAFDYDLDQGNISNRRVVVTIPDELKGYPDGMAIDQEGMIWVALWAGFKVTRWNPHTGELLQSISLPAPNVTSCTFGGLNMNELYITTARKDLDQAALAQYPLAGSVFRLKTDIVGMKNFEFIG